MSTVAVKRLSLEAKQMASSPPEFITASPDPKNMLLWHYCLQGPPGTPYEGGAYLGTVTFPPSYPFAPPSIRMTTPSGRFEPGKRLCLSISDYHPETWNPIWTIHTILIGLLAFMVGSDQTTGSITSSAEEKQQLAEKSKEQFNPDSTMRVYPVIAKSGNIALSFRQ